MQGTTVCLTKLFPALSLFPEIHTGHDLAVSSMRILRGLHAMQLLNAADAKVVYGLVRNWEPLKAIVEELMEEETISGDRLMQILLENDAEFFPDPFVAGFGRGEDGNAVYPGSDKPGAEQVPTAPAFWWKSNLSISNGSTRCISAYIMQGF